MVWKLPPPYPRRGACEAIPQRREDARSHARTGAPCLWRGPDAAPPYGARRSWLLTHDASPRGGKEGGLGGSGGRGSRRRSPWPHSGQRVLSVPVHCHSHSATRLTGRAGGSGGWSSSWRPWRRARALHRLARQLIRRLCSASPGARQARASGGYTHELPGAWSGRDGLGVGCGRERAPGRPAHRPCDGWPWPRGAWSS